MRINKFLLALFPLSIAIIVLDKIRLHVGIIASPYRILQTGILLLMFVIILINRKTSCNFPSPMMLALFGFISFALMSTLFAHGSTESMRRMIAIGEFAVMSFVLFFYLRKFYEIGHIEVFAKVACWTCIFSGLTIISDFFAWTDFSTILFDYGTPQRQIGILGEPNIAAGRLAVFLPFVMYVSFKNRKEHKVVKNIIYTTCFLIVSIAILMTGSRMGMVMLAIIFACVAVKERKYFATAKGLPFVGLYCLFLLSVWLILWQQSGFSSLVTYEAESLYRFASTGKSPDDNILGRVEMLKFGWRIFSDNPLAIVIGLGLGAYSHNTFLDVLFGTGFPCFLFFAAILLCIAVSICNLGKLNALSDLSFYFGLSFLNVIIMLFFLPHLHCRFLWGMYIPISMFIEWNEKSKRWRIRNAVNMEGKR